MGEISLLNNSNLSISEKLSTEKKNISILGSTGSIGRSSLSVISFIEISIIYMHSANQNSEMLLSQCLKWNPKYAVIYDSTKAKWLKEEINKFDLSTILLIGEEGLNKISSDQC